jgi:MFS family permease
MLPQVLATIQAATSGPRRAKAMGLYGATAGLSMVLGQILGGVLVAADIAGTGWRAVFLVNVPVVLVGLVLAVRAVPETRARRPEPVDGPGTVLLAAALLTLLVPLTEGRASGWPLWTWLSLAAAVPLLAGFVAWQRRLAARGGAPLLAPALFSKRPFVVGLLSTMVFYAGMASFFLVLAVYLQQGRGLDALESGLVFTPLAVGYLAASIASQPLAPRLGKQVLALGGVIRAASLAALALTVGAIGLGGSTGVLVPALLADGIGMGLLTAPLVSTVLAGMEARDAGAATGVLSTANQVGNTLGVAVIGAVFYGALGGAGDFAGAFELAVAAIAGVSLAVAALVQLLPGRARVPGGLRPRASEAS